MPVPDIKTMKITKNLTIALIIMLLIAVGLTVKYQLLTKTTNNPRENSQINSITIISVETLANNVNQYLDSTVNLKGVVSFVYPESQTLVIIDNKEFASCGVVTCAINQIPVSYTGTLPKVKDYVQVSGIVSSDSSGKLIIKATQVIPQ